MRSTVLSKEPPTKATRFTIIICWANYGPAKKTVGHALEQWGTGINETKASRKKIAVVASAAD